MELLLIALLVVAAAYIIVQKLKPIQKANTTDKAPAEKANIDYTTMYKPQWLFSYAEKDAFRAINAACATLGYTALAKVRLFDLVEPQSGKHYKTLRYKIQAKHVDFVICNEKLVARVIVELDDNSHNTQERKTRDTFVDSVLTNCGYKVLRYRSIDKNTLANDIKTAFQYP